MNIVLLYGTETGNAELLCDDLQDALADAHEVEIINLDDTSPDALDPSRYHIFVSSTYGEGDVPQSAVTFYKALTETPPDLSALRFSIFGLGDSAYQETFANGSKRLMDALIAAGARQIGRRAIHDASGTEAPEDIAIPWAKERVAEAEAVF